MDDVCIIGLGRVGLPLALSLEENGLAVSGVDLNHEALAAAFQKGEMPFYEPEYDDLIKQSKIKVFPAKQYPEAKAYVITVGTPLKQHIETDLSYVKNVVESLFENTNMNAKLLILRSTLSPGTTTYIKNWINTKTEYEVGKNVFLAMCPERLAEGVAHKELTELPQVIGTEDILSADKAYSVFSVFGVKIFHTNYIEAELSKLFCNIYRYISMSVPNYFAYLCNHYNVDSNKIFTSMNTDYPRNNGLKSPGFSAGTCVEGNRKIKLYCGNDVKYVTYKELFDSGMTDYEVDSFDSAIKLINKKKIIKTTKRIYSGKMYKFNLSNDKTFECTDNHLIPIKNNNLITIKMAKNITTEDILLEFV